ncbi:mechanosensitive channel MscK [Parahaliea aestuarii]|uniref:mechanosensitive channel MscK n=1 Tax=Parahaliea aestuarii TaxID=1852021 RepID=UPI001C9D5659|nr:mechanosensitive channel MscK [Parahaliea aestuarii]
MRIQVLLLTLLFLCLASQVQAQSSGGFSLPGISELEKKLTGDGAGNGEGQPTGDEAAADSGQYREILEQTLALRREIDANRETVDELKTQENQAPRQRAELQQALDDAHHQQQQAWHKQYRQLSLAALVDELSRQLDALDVNQQKLAEVSSELTRAQTLPEQAQTTISDSLARMDDIHRQLNRRNINLDELERTRLQTELVALETRIQLRDQELSVASTLEELAWMRKRVLEADEAIIQARLDVLQPMVNQQREETLGRDIDAADPSLPGELAEHPRFKEFQEHNNSLRDQIRQASDDVNDLIRAGVNAETRLDRARLLSSTVNDQISMLDGSLLLSRILYEQQKSLPEYSPREGLDKQISDIRLEQFDIRQSIQELESQAPELNDSNIDLSETQLRQVQDALQRLRDTRLQLLTQLDQELSRKLNILVRLNLSQQQLQRITSDLHETISEQTFWMPSAQPLPSWIQGFPGQASAQLKDIPWSHLGEDGGNLLRTKWPWLLLPLLFASALWFWRPKLRAHIQALNGDIGILKRDSQLHTPRAIIYTAVLSAPIPLALSLVGWGLWAQVGPLGTVLGAALAKIALLWLVFELCYRLLARDGIAQRHFRWNPAANLVLRRRLLVVGLTMVPMTLVIAFGEEWPAQLSNDRIGLVTMIACLMIISATLTRAALAYQARRYSNAVKGGAVILCCGVPLALVALIAIGYYFTAVRLSGRMIDTLYLLLLWILVDATVVRGLAVAAQRLAFQRAVAEREAEPRENIEGVDVEEPQLELQQVNQQSLRLIRLAVLGLFGLLLYWVWSDVINAFSYTDTIVLWQSTEGSGLSATSSPISLGDVITSLAIGIATFMLVANLPGLLEVLLLSRMNLRQGASYAFTTLLSYLLILIGVIVALSTLGLSWSKMQWLVAALGVGLGFGLQEIFANFISGIIILFERPIHIGDVITIGDLSGTVSRIRTRATTIIDFERKEIIVPNKMFVTERLINWTLSDTVTQLRIKVGFAYGSDLQTCHDLLAKVATENQRVLRDPEPLILFMAFGASTLDHELRVYLGEIGDILFATDELNRAIDKACRERGVEIAYNQIGVHLHSTTDNSGAAGDSDKKTSGRPGNDVDDN